MVSSSTEASASLTGIFELPQCSCASAGSRLSKKDIYPYFFRTTASAILYGYGFLDWVENMGWETFTLLYADDTAGDEGNIHYIPN